MTPREIIERVIDRSELSNMTVEEIAGAILSALDGAGWDLLERPDQIGRSENIDYRELKGIYGRP